MGCHFLLQGIFLTQASNPHLLHLLHWQANFFTTVPPGKPLRAVQTMIRKGVSPGTCRGRILQSPKDWCHFIAPGKSLPQERNHIRSFSMKMSTEKMYSLKVENYVSFKLRTIVQKRISQIALKKLFQRGKRGTRI